MARRHNQQSGDAQEKGGRQPEVQLEATPFRPEGSLVVIGGHENKEGHRPILQLVAQRAGTGKLVVVTMASEEPEEQWREYRETFRELGVKRIEQLDVRRREELMHDSPINILDDARVVFFAGGDQTKITTKLGGTPLCDRMRQIYQEGATIAGTSSGASVMTEVMMAGGESDRSYQVGGKLGLAPGLGLVSGVIIDQHFAERGRMGRLLGAIANNPRLLGIGIDENTAFVFEGHQQARVIGSGAVYIVDGCGITHTNASESEKQTISVFGVKLHVLSNGDEFDLGTRTPVEAKL